MEGESAMDFSLTSEQTDRQRRIREWAERSLNDGLEARDRTRTFNREGWRASAQFGLPGLTVPSNYGGAELDPVATMAALEALGRGSSDNGFSFALNAHLWGCVNPLATFGTEEQKGSYLPRLANGEWIGALGATEREAGSDIFSLKTRATRRDDAYVLAGGKMLITNAPVADVHIVLATVDPQRGAFGLTAFIVERGTPGLRVSEPIDKMGLSTAQMGELTLDDCVVPARNRLGAEGAGLALFNHTMEWERGFIMSFAVGAMERQLESCVAYARERKQFGQPIAQFQALADRLVDMRVRWETSRLLLYRFAWLKSQQRAAPAEAAMTKLALSEAWVRSCEDAMRIYGGHGFLTRTGVERELRDALGSLSFSGTAEMQRRVMARLMEL
jgi:alkylation response protein AidB-like acyl-CoA dehydrogenase